MEGLSNSSCREPLGYVNQRDTSVELPTTQDTQSVGRETAHVDYRVGCGGQRSELATAPVVQKDGSRERRRGSIIGARRPIQDTTADYETGRPEACFRTVANAPEDPTGLG